jgi:hypothetical protein
MLSTEDDGEPVYWQAPNSKDLLRVDGETVVAYPNIAYSDTFKRFQDYDFAEHIRHEQRGFFLVEVTDPTSLMLVMLLLRDRYFPPTWLPLINAA